MHAPTSTVVVHNQDHGTWQELLFKLTGHACRKHMDMSLMHRDILRKSTPKASHSLNKNDDEFRWCGEMLGKMTITHNTVDVRTQIPGSRSTRFTWISAHAREYRFPEVLNGVNWNDRAKMQIRTQRHYPRLYISHRHLPRCQRSYQRICRAIKQCIFFSKLKW